MKIKKTKFKDLLILENKSFNDKRGFFKELFKEKLIKKKFPFLISSFSKKNVIRGLHIQLKNPQGKLVTVIKGRIFDVVLDLRPNSKKFGEIYKIELSEKNSQSLYIPPGFAHGFCGLDKENYIIYSCTNYRNKQSEMGIMWNDKELKIKWPTKKPIISNKDKENFSFKEIKSLIKGRKTRKRRNKKK